MLNLKVHICTLIVVSSPMTVMTESADILDSGEMRWSERANAVVSATKQQDAVKACTKKFA